MKQSLLLSIALLLLSSSSLVTPIHARNKSHPAAKSPSQAPAPGPSSSDCSSVILDLMSCLSYLSIGSNETKPEKSCCVSIEGVLKFNPQCICAGLVSASQMGVELNNTRALATPKTCKLSISPPHCGILTPSATTPGAPPVSPSAGTPKTSPSVAKSPATSPSSDETVPIMTSPSPSTSGINILSVPALTIVAVTVSSIAYISAFSS